MPAHRGQNGRCLVCQHEARTQIELLMAHGNHQRALARKYPQLSRHALGRHWRGHVSPERKQALVCSPVERVALQARVCEESTSILDHHRAVRQGLYHTYDAAVTAGDSHAVALLAGRLIEVNNSIAKITGELVSGGILQQHNTLVINGRPTSLQEEVAKLDELVAEALEHDYPEALAAVRDLIRVRLQELEGPEALPALEHHHEETAEAV
jgi:hypothetical protein